MLNAIDGTFNAECDTGSSNLFLQSQATLKSDSPEAKYDRNLIIDDVL